MSRAALRCVQNLFCTAAVLLAACPALALERPQAPARVCTGYFTVAAPAELPERALPTALASRRRNEARARPALGPLAASTRLRVTTFNANKINRSVLNNPTYLDSRPRFAAEIRRHLGGPKAPDVLVLQEIWEKPDHQEILDLAAELGYAPIAADWDVVGVTGLQILLRASAGTVERSGFREFLSPTDRPENVFWERAGGVRRGVLSAVVKFPDGQRGLIGTLHGTPLEFHADVRARQMAQLNDFLLTTGPSVDFAVIAGDFNIPADSAESAGFLQGRFQAKGRRLYDGLFASAGLVDAFRAVADADREPGYTTNPDVRHSLPLRLLARAGMPIQRERIDFVFVREAGSGTLLHVEQSHVVFDQPVRLPGEATGQFLSDHFGVGALIHAFRPSKR